MGTLSSSYLLSGGPRDECVGRSWIPDYVQFLAISRVTLPSSMGRLGHQEDLQGSTQALLKFLHAGRGVLVRDISEMANVERNIVGILRG